MKSTPVKKPFNLILLGDPASGKGTQAARLAKRYHFYNLDMGREVRKPQALAQYDYAKTTAIGHLTPTVVVRNIFKRVIAATPAKKGILFNGNPKMVNEAKLVARELLRAKRTDPLVIYLHIPLTEIYKRAEKRRRDDDSARALRNRQKYYKEQISRVVVFFGERYTVKKISGMGTEAEVEKKIEAAIKRYGIQNSSRN